MCLCQLLYPVWPPAPTQPRPFLLMWSLSSVGEGQEYHVSSAPGGLLVKEGRTTNCRHRDSHPPTPWSCSSTVSCTTSFFFWLRGLEHVPVAAHSLPASLHQHVCAEYLDPELLVCAGDATGYQPPAAFHPERESACLCQVTPNPAAGDGSGFPPPLPSRPSPF